MGEYEMEFDAEKVELVERWPGKTGTGSVKQSFRLPIGEVPNLIASLAAALDHLQGHPHHGRDGAHE